MFRTDDWNLQEWKMTDQFQFQSQMSRASWSEFTMHNHADYSSAQWAVTALVRYATCTVLAESCVSAGHQGKAFDWCQQTNFTTP